MEIPGIKVNMNVYTPNIKGATLTMSQENGVGKAVVYVKLKDGVLDPQGSTIKRALEDMGYQGIKDIRFGKMFEITFRKDGKG
ncbi:MAG: phosphoribosylformylglycinamidine synthase subunit PurS, partial [Candidatus Zixiibacteriota bacterium]